ncbi:MAG: DUF1353 domain-containing protein, partial [Xanthobacteraceae bacterium]
YSRAATLHDFLCARIAGGGRAQALERKAADAIFLEAMRASGVNRAVRSAMWAAVRLYGSFKVLTKGD